MAKTPKEVKNAHPEIYGYEHPWDIPGNTKESITVYCMPSIDADGERRYYICSRELFEWDRNERSRRRKTNDRLTRCWIYAEDSNRRHKCRCKCNECPYGKTKRDISVLSLERLYEEYEYELPDDCVGIEERIMERERARKLEELIGLLNETDKAIIELFKMGKSDSEIAAELNKPRTTVMSRRNRIFDDLREQLKDF